MSSTAIRFVTLHPSKASEELAISLSTCQLPSSHFRCMDYDAISYACGSTRKETTRTIMCQGNEFPVPETISAALRYLRPEQTSKRLWIDAICMTTDDAHQRRAMLRLVPRIFGHARRIVVWLGPESAADKDALRIIERLDHEVVPGLSWWAKFRRAPRLPAPPTTELLANMNMSKSSLQQLMHFYDRPWFRSFSILRDRKWSRYQQVVAQVGSQTIAFGSVMRLAEALCQISISPQPLVVNLAPLQDFVLPEGLKYPEQMVALRKSGRSGNKMSYLACFHLATINHCFMPNWTIHAMLGWVDLTRYHEDIPWEFDPDYHWLGHGEGYRVEASSTGSLSFLKSLWSGV